MSWFIFACLSAVSESAKDIFSKLSSQKTNVYTAGIALHSVTLFFTLPVLFWTGIPSLKPEFWLGAGAFVVITPLWTLLYMKALQISELSKVIPVMAFNPLLTALLTYWFNDGTIELSGWLGILAISAGIYFIYSTREILTGKLFAPIRHLFTDKGAMMMLGVAFLWSLGAHFAKMRVVGSAPVFSTFIGACTGVVTTYIVALIRRQKVDLRDFIRHASHLAPVGFFYYLATIFSSYALVSGETAYVFAIKRGSIILSSGIGKYQFGERLNRAKLLGIILVGLGIILLAH